MTVSSRNPAKDNVAIASAATTGFKAFNTDRSQLSYAAEACISALQAAGLQASDVDGIIGSSPSAPELQQALGIPEVTYFANPSIPFVNQISAAVGAVYSGLCNVALVYHCAYRLPWNTGSATKDPFRRNGMAGGPTAGIPESVSGAVGYTAWASRYLHDFDRTREDLGLVAISDRSNAARNPNAAKREPLTMEDYLSARMIREPLCMLDMDIAVDGADAFVITTPERAGDMPLKPVLINAVTLGMTGKPDETQTPSLREHGQQVVIDSLKARGDFWIEDCDVYLPYDGFSIITVNWIENVGFCGPGEAGDFMRQHWDAATNSIRINGRMAVNPHGGSLSEGATQGSGHVREAVHQLQGLAGPRQVPDAKRAIITAGGFFFNAQGCLLRTE